MKPQHKAFADFYLISMNATDSYMKAYPKSNYESARRTGQRLLSQVDIRAYIDEKLSEMDNKRIASAEEVLELLTKMARGEIQEETVVAYNKHAEIVKKQVVPRDRIKAAELLGKRYALFTEKIDLSGDVGLHINVDYGDADEES